MEVLKELVDLHRANKTQRAKILGTRQGRNSTKMYQLYEAVLRRKVASDEEAMVFLFGKGRNRDPEVRRLYSNLKKRLERRLIDGLFLIELSDDKYRSQIVTNLYKLYAAAQILSIRTSVKAAIQTARKGLKGAEEHGDSKLAMDFCEILVRRYAFLGDERKMKKYKALFKKYEHLEGYRKEVEDLYLSLASFFAKAQGITEGEVKKLGRRIQELKENFPRQTSFLRIDIILISLESIYLQLVADHEKNVELCQRGLALLERYPNQVTIGNKLQLLTNKLYSHIYLGDREEAEELAAQIRMLKKDRLDWYTPYRISILSRLWFRDYQGAFDLFLEVLENRAYKRQKLHMEENWRILHAYLYFFYKQGFICTRNKDENLVKRFTNFRLNRFMHEMPVYTRDKRGYNVTLLSLQALLWLQQKKLDRFFDKIEALKTYNYKYLRRNQTFRSHCYLRMLIRLSVFGEKRIEKDKHTQVLLRKMQSFPMKTLEVEVIPYEHQWEFALALMHEL